MNLKLLWYCTKSDLKLYKTRDGDYTTMKAKDNMFGYEELNGKIVAVSDYDCEKIIHTYENGASVHHRYSTKTLNNEQLLRKSRIFGQGLNDYLGDHDYDKNNNVVGYAIHIKNLKDFENPCELDCFYRYDGEKFIPLKRAPQNMCYVFDKYGNKYVVISVRPEWLAMILNGLKTIEVRRKVLKEMIPCK